MLSKHPLYALMVGGLILLGWFFPFDLKGVFLHLLSAVLTLSLIAVTVFLVQRKSNLDHD